MKRTHKQLNEREKRFPTGYRKGYAGYLELLDGLRARQYSRDRGNMADKRLIIDEVIATFQDPPPEALSGAYDLTDDQIERLTVMQRKYMYRFSNIRRSWSRLLQYMPEIMQAERKYRVLEMSTGHGATLEILRHFGHEVTGNDYANIMGGDAVFDTRYRVGSEEVPEEIIEAHKNGEEVKPFWPYQALIEALDLKVDLFDAGVTPYPYEDNAFDTVLCFDAIGHYAHPSDWMRIIDEFTRIASESVFIVTNPIQKQFLDDEDYVEGFFAFQRAMRGYDKDGFRCVHAGFVRNHLTAFKLVKFG